MPEYVYRAITKEGVIVRNRVDSPSKQTLIKSRRAITNRYCTSWIWTW